MDGFVADQAANTENDHEDTPVTDAETARRPVLGSDEPNLLRPSTSTEQSDLYLIRTFNIILQTMEKHMSRFQ